MSRLTTWQWRNLFIPIYARKLFWASGRHVVGQWNANICRTYSRGRLCGLTVERSLAIQKLAGSNLGLRSPLRDMQRNKFISCARDAASLPRDSISWERDAIPRAHEIKKNSACPFAGSVSAGPLSGNSLRQAARSRMCLCHQAV